MSGRNLQPVPEPTAIDRCTAAMAVAFQRTIDAATMRIYRETLQDLPLWAIDKARIKLQREGGKYFPTAGEWHQAAEQVIEDRTRDELGTAAVPVEYDCETCRDTGWVSEPRTDPEGKPTEVCIPCSCRPTNPVYQRMTKTSQVVRKGREDSTK